MRRRTRGRRCSLPDPRRQRLRNSSAGHHDGFGLHSGTLAQATFPSTSSSLDSNLVEEEVVPVLYVDDAARAVAWYERLGFRKEWEHQFEPGFPWFVSVARGHVRLYLSEHKGDARPNTLIHLYVTDIDAVSKSSGLPSMKRASPGGSANSKIPMATGCGLQLDAPDATGQIRRRHRR